jgi:hypothetical protein
MKIHRQGDFIRLKNYITIQRVKRENRTGFYIFTAVILFTLFVAAAIAANS